MFAALPKSSHAHVGSRDNLSVGVSRAICGAGYETDKGGCKLDPRTLYWANGMEWCLGVTSIGGITMIMSFLSS